MITLSPCPTGLALYIGRQFIRQGPEPEIRELAAELADERKAAILKRLAEMEGRKK